MGYLNTYGATEEAYYKGDDLGRYQFTSLENIINQFQIAYVGENKLIPKLKKADVAFHAMRALQELSFDTFKSCKSQEILLPASLQMKLPHDYVNYTKISSVDSAGIKHLLYPTSKTSNPFSPQQDAEGNFLFNNGDLVPNGDIVRNGNFINGQNDWVLNYTRTTSGGVTGPIATTVSTAIATLGNPTKGYFYGFDGNAIGAYDIPQNLDISQQSLPIESDTEYKIKYTLSGYTSGTWNFHIIDKNGDYVKTTDRTANGTYEETVTTSANAGNYTPNSIFFRNSSITNGNVVITNISVVRVGDEDDSYAWNRYKSSTPSENNNDDYEDNTYWPANGERYGLDPQHAQANGSFYIDCVSGKIHFSSNISGKTVILDYISDSLGTDAEMQVHKFAEDAMYKYIIHAVMSTSSYGQQLVPRLTKEKFAAIRKAKLRLSSIKLEELTQILRGKSKQIKH